VKYKSVVDVVLTNGIVMCWRCGLLFGTELWQGNCCVWQWGWWLGVIRLRGGTVYRGL